MAYMVMWLAAVSLEVNAVSGFHVYTLEELLLLVPCLLNNCPQMELPEDCTKLQGYASPIPGQGYAIGHTEETRIKRWAAPKT